MELMIFLGVDLLACISLACWLGAKGEMQSDWDQPRPHTRRS